MLSKINFPDKFTKIGDFWSPRVVANLNDYQFKLVKLKGEFTWHTHPKTDEAFIVLEGEMEIAFSDGVLQLSAGEMVVVPKGVVHKPYAQNECHAMIVEPRGVINTGDAGGPLTAENDVWI